MSLKCHISSFLGLGISVGSNDDFTDLTTRSSVNPGFMVSYRSKSEYYSRGTHHEQHKTHFYHWPFRRGQRGASPKRWLKSLGWKFINADVLGCAAHIGRTVSEVCRCTEGERAFNRCLTEILSHQITKENVVVTTDESIICDEKARELLKSEFTVYLKVSVPLCN
jgi:hypothetical protein